MAKPAITLRSARPEDVEMICKLIYELAVYERAPEECHARPEAMREQLFGEKPPAEAIVAEVDGKIAGYAIYFHNFSTWEAAPGLYLEDVYVRPTYRRNGIGKMFLQYLAALAVERGCKRFEWSVLDWNKPARDFYESLGSKAMVEWVPYRTEGKALTELAKQGKALRKKNAPKEEKKPKPSARPGKSPLVVIHTDGGAQPNPGVGGWAAVLEMGDNRKELSGGELATTNNRMEMTAAIKALESLKKSCKVELYTDSVYLRSGITQWIKNWKRNGWKTKTGPVKNAELWRRLDELCGRHEVEWKWLRGHSGHEENERCDELCNEMISGLLAETTEEQRAEALRELEGRFV